MPNISRRIQHEQVRKLIDFIIFLSMDDKVFNERYNSAYNISTANINVSDELEKLFELKEKGIITLTEFEDRKKKLL